MNIPKLEQALKCSYKYDKLNRLTTMDAYKGLNNATNVFTPVGINDYNERVSYDPNGNILTYKRNGDAARSIINSGGMDNLTYTYKPNKNQLSSVLDSATDATSDYARYNDIRKDKTYNYEYDSIGNLISDAGEEITMEWNVYGKITSIAKTGVDISYTYDASGNRISKKVNNQYTYYVRDAQGNVMSIYEYEDTLKQKEIMLYGSSRLGTFKVDKNVQNCVTPPLGETIIFTRGNKLFELSNHLGNILATISDKKIGVDSNSDGIIDYYSAEVVSANDYYPFGMMMPGRKYSAASTNYRYGFNGKELDKEVSATTTYDYGYRIYSPGLGRFLSVDPLSKSYPWLTPFQYASNNPIYNIDIDGLEGLPAPLKRGMEELEQGWNRTVENVSNWFKSKKEATKEGVTKATNAVLDAAAVSQLTQSALMIDFKVPFYSEAEKKFQFEHNANSAVAILLYEYALGKGNAEHTFYWSKVNENSFANKVIEGRVKTEITTELYNTISKDINSYQDHLASGQPYIFSLAFSPDDTKTIGEAIEKHLTSNLAQFFVGGATVSAKPVDETTVEITLINFTSRNSLMLHLGENYPMEKEKKNDRTQLSTTSQTILFRLINLNIDRTTGVNQTSEQTNP